MAIAEKERSIEILLDKPDYLVQPPLEFLRDFQAEASTAKERVYIKAMVIEQGHASGLFLNSVRKAAERGVETRVILDKHSDKVAGENPSLQQILTRKQLEELNKAGVRVEHTNPPRGLMSKIPVLGKFSGRDHIKIYIADNSAWVGGINLEDVNFNNVDFMVKVSEKPIVEALVSLTEKTYEPVMDYELKPAEDTRILVDVGKSGESKILDEAVNLVDNASESIENFTMFFPDGKFLKALKRAKQRGVSLKIISSDPDQLKVGLSRMVQKASGLRYSLEHKKDVPVMQHNQFVHGKLLIVDGKTAMFGSHNLSSKGVLLGTEELAIVTTNEGLVKDLNKLFRKELGRSNQPLFIS